MEQIKTYPEMNETIKDLLRRSEEPMNLYILARIEELERQASLAPAWISVEDALPATDEKLVLVIVNGKPRGNITLTAAQCLATYYPEEGWVIEEYPEWENPGVTHWMQLPEPPEGIEEAVQ